MNDVPKIIRGAMGRSGMSTEHLALRCGVARSTMNKYLKEPQSMRLDTAAYLMKATNMTDEDRLEILKSIIK